MLSSPYVIVIASIATLIASFYKESIHGPGTTRAKWASRAHHFFQFAVVIIACWAAVEGNLADKARRNAQLDAEGSHSALTHLTPIFDIYIKQLLPAGPLLRNHDDYVAVLATMPPELQTRLAWETRVTPKTDAQRVAALQAFDDLQKIACAVEAEAIQYGKHYPPAMEAWASHTLALKESDLGKILSDSPSGQDYAGLISSASSDSLSRHHKATQQLEN